MSALVRYPGRREHWVTTEVDPGVTGLRCTCGWYRKVDPADVVASSLTAGEYIDRIRREHKAEPDAGDEVVGAPI